MLETTIIACVPFVLVIVASLFYVLNPRAKDIRVEVTHPTDPNLRLLDDLRDCRLAHDEDVEGLHEADMRIVKLETALAFYADEDRWDGQRFVTCAEPWDIAQQAVDGTDIDDIIQASATPPEADGDAADAVRDHLPEPNVAGPGPWGWVLRCGSDLICEITSIEAGFNRRYPLRMNEDTAKAAAAYVRAILPETCWNTVAEPFEQAMHVIGALERERSAAGTDGL